MKGIFKVIPMTLGLCIAASPDALAFSSKKKEAPTGESVWIRKSDGGVSCEQEKAESLEKGAETLKNAGVEVLESAKSSDGKMHIQVCGAPTGSENRYRISKSDIEKARVLGFSEGKTSPTH